MSVKMRQIVERRIARALVVQAIKAGYYININNGGDDYELPEPTNNVKKVLDTMFATDEEYLVMFKDGKHAGWVYFVYGNDGWDVISDYTINLEHIMTNANKVSERYQ